MEEIDLTGPYNYEVWLPFHWKGVVKERTLVCEGCPDPGKCRGGDNRCQEATPEDWEKGDQLLRCLIV